MFEAYHRARHRKRHRAVPWLVGGGALVHATIIVAMWLSTLWRIEKLDLPGTHVRLVVVAPFPPPPPPPPAGHKPDPVVPIQPHRHRVHDLVQPVPPAEVTPTPPTESPITSEAEPGVDAGEFLGEPDGVVGAPAVEPVVTHSLAAPPRPLGRYDVLTIRHDAGDRRDRDRTSVTLVLEIDARGVVQRVLLGDGVGDELDMRAMAIARRFRFHPALDASGAAIPSRMNWIFYFVQQPTPA